VYLRRVIIEMFVSWKRSVLIVQKPNCTKFYLQGFFKLLWHR
jgi:hypothetical protein